MSSIPDRGILYIATGQEYVEEALLSAKSVKKKMPEEHITLITNIEINSQIFDRVKRLESASNDFGDQVYNLENTPYNRTIFLDTDIYITDRIDELFDTLDEFDLAATHNLTNFASDRVDLDSINKIPESFPEYNSGVVAYKSTEKLNSFFSNWKDCYEIVVSHGEVHNQAAFRLALYRSDLRIATLPFNYNCRYRHPGCVNNEVKVFHGRLLDLNVKGAGKRVETNQAISEINKRNDLRSYYRVSNTVRLANPNLIEKVAYSIRDSGVISTVKKGLKKFNNKL